ncbi:hypothetical protein SAMN04487891_11123 [Flagellimonas taeanensis]|uniref:Uncharacterized protein n=1 Tax=Flagellimonas taeanensis TaxID=1005926 RepID=A0A1M6WFY0_9FLAO|nr:hypothetical protein [Allomuricauda taeanensis]SFC43576.1 hypothetical protein SAMN04487891_11123 [Allomuricauda taeanensis]SHK92693.1 hypothetical protein SAMN05216293_2288 [Allomuricauda taeanensis]
MISQNLHLRTKQLPIFLSLILLSVLFKSCSKDDGNTVSGEGFLRCRLNGELKEFNNFVNANDPPQEETVHFVVVGGFEKENINKSPSFGIMLVSEENIIEGTYSVAGESSPELDGQYCMQVYDGETHTGTECFIGGRSSETYFILNITSMDDWGVKGTFSGLLRDVDDNLLEVTEGEFAAAYNQ